MNKILISCTLFLVCIPLLVDKHHHLRYKDTIIKFDPWFRDFIIDVVRGYHPINFENYTFTNGNRTSSEPEVRNCIKAALAFNVSGRTEKALKLFEHAISISPDIPEVSNRYGEYLGHVHEYVTTVDELYFKALTYAPELKNALINFNRTVDELDRRILGVIDGKRKSLEDQTKSQLHYQIVRKIYLLQIFHMLGVEGSTATLPELHSFLKTGRVITDKTVAEHNVILGLEAAFAYIKSLAEMDTITLEEIFELHRSVMGHVDPLRSGVYRRRHVLVGDYVAPPVKDLPKLMEGYVKWINSDEARAMHPIRYAALAHYKLTIIRPFYDGNGRTSRFLMNLIFLRSRYPPIIINRGDWQKYYNYLRMANRGDVQPFVRLIAYSAHETLNAYLGSTKLLFTNKSEGRPDELSRIA